MHTRSLIALLAPLILGSLIAPVAARPHASLVAIDGYWMLDLAGGTATIRPAGPRAQAPARRVSGRVFDRNGRPVAGASVLIDTSIQVRGNNVMVAAGATTDANGVFSTETVPVGDCVAIALADGEWSAAVPVTGDAVELRLAGHGALVAALRYGGQAEQFDLRLDLHDRPFSAKLQTTPDGRLAIDSLPPGNYRLSIEVAHGVFGGQPRSIEREIAIGATGTTQVTADLEVGTTVALVAHPPGDAKVPGLKYWLFAGPAAPATAALARTRAMAAHAISQASGGNPVGTPVQFHDIPPGTYAACVAVFDVRTMDAADSPYGCTSIVVHDGDSVVEDEVTLR